MNEDDLPPQKYVEDEGGFAEALGWTFGRFAVIAVLFAIVATVIYLAVHYL